MTTNQDDYVDTSSDGRSASPAPSMYSFSSSVDGRLMVRAATDHISPQLWLMTRVYSLGKPMGAS